MHPFIKNFFRNWGLWGAGLLAVAASPFLPFDFYLVEMIRPFQMQVVWAAAILGAFLVWRRTPWPYVALPLAAFALALFSVLPFWPEKDVSGEGGTTLYLANIHKDNKNPAIVESQLQELKPDLVVLLEVDARWLEALAPVLQDYRGAGRNFPAE